MVQSGMDDGVVRGFRAMTTNEMSSMSTRRIQRIVTPFTRRVTHLSRCPIVTSPQEECQRAAAPSPAAGSGLGDEGT